MVVTTCAFLVRNTNPPNVMNTQVAGTPPPCTIQSLKRYCEDIQQCTNSKPHEVSTISQSRTPNYATLSNVSTQIVYSHLVQGGGPSHLRPPLYVEDATGQPTNVHGRLVAMRDATGIVLNYVLVPDLLACTASNIPGVWCMTYDPARHTKQKFHPNEIDDCSCMADVYVITNLHTRDRQTRGTQTCCMHDTHIMLPRNHQIRRF